MVGYFTMENDAFIQSCLLVYLKHITWHGFRRNSAGWIYMTTGEEAGCPANMDEIWQVA